MSSRRTICVDCDEVLSDFMTPALHIIRKLGGPYLKRDEAVFWDVSLLLPNEPDEYGCNPRAAFMAEIGQYGWCSALKPLPDAADVIEALRSFGNVVCVTAPLEGSATWSHERLLWLKKHFGFDKKHVVLTNNKALVRGHVLADDGPHNCEDWGGGTAFLVARNHNAYETRFPRGSFSQFIDYAKQCVED